MDTLSIEEDTARFWRRLKREKIVVPGPHQYVDSCNYSKTGWAVWNVGGGCTCHPAKKPKNVKRDTL